MENKKIVEIPVPIFLYKFLKSYAQKEVINLPFDLPFPDNRDPRNVKSYFEEAEIRKFPKINVCAYSQTPRFKYSAVRYFRQIFYHHLYIYVEAHNKVYFDIKSSIAMFLNQYNISEDDYKIETVVKKYQRFRERPKHQRLFF